MFDRCQIDVKANFVFFEVKTDHAAIHREMFAISHRQDGSVFETGEEVWDVLPLIGADKDNVATLGSLKLRQMLRPKGAVANGLPAKDLVQLSLKRITERTENQRSFGIVEGVRGHWVNCAK